MNRFSRKPVKSFRSFFHCGKLILMDWFQKALILPAFQLFIREMKEEIVGRRSYILDYPNMEVKSSLNRWILNYLVADVVAKSENENALVKAVIENRPKDLKPLFQSFFASIPHDWYRKNQLAGYEGYYASIFYCYFIRISLLSVLNFQKKSGI